MCQNMDSATVSISFGFACYSSGAPAPALRRDHAHCYPSSTEVHRARPPVRGGVVKEEGFVFNDTVEGTPRADAVTKALRTDAVKNSLNRC
jgi:hypothetical protein